MCYDFLGHWMVNLKILSQYQKYEWSGILNRNYNSGNVVIPAQNYTDLGGAIDYIKLYSIHSK